MSGYWSGKKFSDEHRQKLSESHEGNAGYWLGKKKPKECVKSMSDTLRKKYQNGEIKPNKGSFAKGRIPWNKGIKTGIIPKSAFKKGDEGYWLGKKREHMSGENHHMWSGGKSFEPYTSEFNSYMKNEIRKRDNNICQLCEKLESKEETRLSIHHIDYDKKNCKDNNLISLCRSCHSKTNKNRNHWTEYFSGLMINASYL